MRRVIRSKSFKHTQTDSYTGMPSCIYGVIIGWDGRLGLRSSRRDNGSSSFEISH